LNYENTKEQKVTLRVQSIMVCEKRCESMNLYEVAIDHETTISWSDSTPNVSQEAVYSELGEEGWAVCRAILVIFYSGRDVGNLVAITLLHWTEES
jgi:hypothetical protein